MSYQNLKDWRKRTKLRMIEAMGGKCSICSYSECYTALEFHHLDPNEKDFNISHGNPKKWESVVIELKKCILLCCRCHREVHMNMTEIPKEFPKFDESFNEVIKRIAKIDNCPVCNKPKSFFNKTCSIKCYSKIRKKIDWNKFDLVSMFNDGLSYSKIGEIIGCCNVAVRKRAKKLGIDNLNKFRHNK